MLHAVRQLSRDALPKCRPDHIGANHLGADHLPTKRGAVPFTNDVTNHHLPWRGRPYLLAEFPTESVGPILVRPVCIDFFFFFFFRRHGEFDLDQLRAVVVECSRRMDKALVFSYDRQGVGQSGSGHFSPLGGYNEAEDLVLVLDTARFKYPPHWVKLDREAGFRPAPSLLSLGSHPPTPLPACRSI